MSRPDLRKWLRETFQRMPREEKLMWRSASSLVELGEMMARWLEGKVSARPGYNMSAPCAPDPETGPLIDVLAGLCRLGFVTEDSQPGVTTDYEQISTLFGFTSAEVVDDLHRLFRPTPGIKVYSCPVDELGYVDTQEMEISYGAVELSWGGPMGNAGWNAILDSWVVVIEETEANEHGVMWSMLATYVVRRRQGLAVAGSWAS